MLFEQAMEYAEAVLSGEEVTTKYVKKQCQWFIDDIYNKDEDFPYYFDLEAIEKVEGILRLLNFATGLGVVGMSVLDGLVGFQSFFLANCFGWKFKDNPEKHRYRDITLFIPRKNSKTWLTAVILIILLLTEDKYSEFYSICVDRDLAGEVKKAMTQLINGSLAISKYFVVPKSLSGKIVCKLTNNFYQARTSEASRNNAIRPSAFVCDEMAAYKDYANYNAMKSGQLSVRNPLRFKLTTAYALDQSIMLEELAYIKKVFDGMVKDDRMFALLYYAEPEHLWDDIGLEMSNPLRIPENYQEIKDSRQSALEKPSERIEFLTKHMNHFLPSNAGEEFINIEDLRKCKIEEFDWRGRNVWVGIDLSQTTDNTAIAICTEEDLKIYADTIAFVPTDRIPEKNRLEKINYQDFIDEGKCHSCGDSVIDYGYVEKILLEIEEKYGVTIMGFAYDRYNCLSTAQKLESHGYKTIEAKQHSSVLHPATKLLKEKILNKEFFYTQNTLLEINFQNARVIEDNNKNLYMNKKRSHGKVDCVAALINSIYILQLDVIFNPESDWAVQII